MALVVVCACEVLKCLNTAEANAVLAEAHSGVCGTHQGAKTLSRRLVRAGLFWSNMHDDATNLVRKCESCQKASNLSNIPAYERINIASAWPFDLWGIDILGLFPQASRQRKFIIVAVEYFTRWVEAESLAKIKATAVHDFIWKNIICRFGLPHALISDNGRQFASAKVINQYI